MKLAALVNPNAGTLNPFRTIDAAVRAIEKEFPDCPVHLTGTEEKAKRFLKSLDAGALDALLVAGGDGTLHLAAKYLLGQPVPIGILPCGTANNIAASLGTPSNPHKALELVRNGRTRAIDVGRARSHIFLESAGVGFHAEALRLYDRPNRKSLVRGVYAISRTLMEFRPFRVKLEMDGRTVDRSVIQATVSNFPRYGQGLTVAPAAAPDDGLLDVTLIGAKARRRLGEYLLAALFGNLAAMEHVETFKAARMRLKTSRPMPVHLDANIRVFTPCMLKAAPAAIEFFVP